MVTMVVMESDGMVVIERIACLPVYSIVLQYKSKINTLPRLIGKEGGWQALVVYAYIHTYILYI